MPPEYHLESFWDDRFKKEDHFEWLGDGSNTILPPIQRYLKTKNPLELPRVLHIGAGTSTLSSDIFKLYGEHFGEREVEEGLIVNTDYSEIAVERGKNSDEGRNKWLRWEKKDLLCWADVQTLQHGQGDARPFEIVVDKSTSDAISCNEDIVFEGAKTTCSEICPLIATHIENNLDEALKLEPVELLALHIAALVPPGGVWVALSYSRHRFHFVEHHRENGENSRVAVSGYWTWEEVTGVDAPSGSHKAGVFTPTVQHYVFVLRRADKEVKL